MAHIHCFSCGRDTVTSEVKQPTEKPIRRCANCHSLNFRVIEEESPTPPAGTVQKEDQSLQEA